MATLIAMCRDLAERLYRESHWPVTGSATGGDSTSLIDTTALLYSSGDPNQFDRKWVYRETSPSDAVTSSRVTEGGLAGGTGDLTLSPALTSSFASGNNYIITDEHIDVLKNAINRYLRNAYLPSFFPLSLLLVGGDDNDMENDPAATNYIGVNSTLANTTTAGEFYNGVQGLKVTATSQAGYARTASFAVNDGDVYYTAVMGACTGGDTLDFQAYDVTNTAVIENATSDERAFMELLYQFTIPSGCEQLQLRLVSVANNDVTFWDDVQLWKTRAVYPLPSWITRPAQMLDVRAFPQGTGGPASDNDYRINEKLSVPLRWGFEREDRRATNELHIWVEATSQRPYIYALRSLSELSSDTANTPADQDSVAFWAEKLIREPERAAHNLALVRSLSFTRPTKPVPRRIGVSM